MPRRPDPAKAALLALLMAGTAHAADYTMANGAVHFTVPDDWPRIMEAKGNPEMMAFQVPDPSPTGQDTLARITVTSTQAADIPAFQAYVSGRMADARTLPAFRANAAQSGPTWMEYTADEGDQKQTYVERYYFKDGRALQLRCIRPAASKAGADWAAAFDRGCQQIADQLK